MKLPVPSEIDFETLPAGRLTDFLVACWYMEKPVRPEGDEWVYVTPEGVEPIPPDSTDIAAAWQVVEASLVPACHTFRLLPGYYTDDIEIFDPSDHGMHWLDEVEAETISLAICRAALYVAKL